MGGKHGIGLGVTDPKPEGLSQKNFGMTFLMEPGMQSSMKEIRVANSGSLRKKSNPEAVARF